MTKLAKKILMALARMLHPFTILKWGVMLEHIMMKWLTYYPMNPTLIWIKNRCPFMPSPPIFLGQLLTASQWTHQLAS